MPWFWGKKKDKDDDDDESYEEYSSDEDYSDEDSSSHHSPSEEEKEDDENSLVSQEDGEDVELDGEGKDGQDEPEVDEKNDEVSSSSHSEDGKMHLEDVENGETREQDGAAIQRSDSLSTDDDDEVSLIESNDDDEDFLNTSDEDDDDDDDDEDTDEDLKVTDRRSPVGAQGKGLDLVQVETVDEDSTDSEDEDNDDPEEEKEEEKVTSFAEKRSLLVLAAEHDRVDILKAILTDDDEDRVDLMNSGIPPLHIAISFGSTNACQSLLRMGADPSIRPNVSEIKKQQADQPTGSQVEIPNMNKFEGASAWELAFGTPNQEKARTTSSWLGLGGDNTKDDGDGAERVVKPVDMQPSKREGIRHAFTAESLRCIGGDEYERLKQLLDSGMPPSIDIGGKDLYGWAVEMGAMRCEELLRPAEAAKHGEDLSVVNTESEGSPAVEGNNESSSQENFRVLDRSKPGDESVSHLINRLDELESLASALSTCLDNLAEEVSVCHGLLLMGGGASALASHVKSLKDLQEHKRDQLLKAQDEWQEVEEELTELVDSSGEVGKEIAAMKISPSTVPLSRSESFRKATSSQEQEAKRPQLMAQIAASENKIRKLRASIADLSDENSKEMEEVERRGLSGGVDLVRGLREGLRDIEFSLSECRNGTATCRAKISMIHSKLSNGQSKEKASENSERNNIQDIGLEPPATQESTTTNQQKFSEAGVVQKDENSSSGDVSLEHLDETSQEEMPGGEASSESQASPSIGADKAQDASSKSEKQTIGHGQDEPSSVEAEEQNSSKQTKVKQTALSRAISATENSTSRVTTTEKTASEKIASGQSQAIAVLPAGSRGYFKVDLWQVILRIMGLDNAAVRRSVQIAQQQRARPPPPSDENNPKLMIV